MVDVSNLKESPILRAFEQNPLRVLRLEVNATTNDAASRAESALTLERVGMTLDETDLLPWLSAPSTYELQQTAQTVEEPLARLLKQMLWFDRVRDTEASLLTKALSEPFGQAVSEYLQTEPLLPAVEPAPDESTAHVVRMETFSSGFPAPRGMACSHCGKENTPDESLCRSCGAGLYVISMGNGEAQPIQQGEQKGKDITIPIEVPLWTAFTGHVTTIVVNDREMCMDCRGAGEHAAEKETCPSCFGDKKRSKVCMRCGGEGTIAGACTACQRNGSFARERPMEIQIPWGVRQNSLLLLRGEGLTSLKGGPPGDLYVEIKFSEHRYYDFQGFDLTAVLPVGVMEGARGDDIEAITPDGPVTVRLPREAQSGTVFRMAGYGLADLKTGTRGDLYYKAVATAEPTLSQQRNVLHEIGDEIASMKPSYGSGYERTDASRDPERAPEVQADLVQVARIVNRANLHLLLGGVFTDAAISKPVTVHGKPVALSRWERSNDVFILSDVHNLVAEAIQPGGPNSDARQHWHHALKMWMQILDHAWFQEYVARNITDLDDDFVTRDDVETVRESVRNYLFDLIAQQARTLMLDGRYELAASVLSALGESGAEQHILTPALRPLRNILQSELSEVEALLDRPDGDIPATVSSYLKRLSLIKKRWNALDVHGITGVNDMLDEAVEKGYLRVRRMEKPDDRVDALLSQASSIIEAKSLRDRLESFRKDIEDARRNVCHFCRTERPEYERLVVLHGKKETGRTREFNRTTIHYLVTKAFVLRCSRCARLHDFIRWTGHFVWMLLLPGATLLALWIVAQLAS